MSYRVLKDFIKTGRLNDADMVIDLIHADGPGCGHTLAKEIDDLAIQRIDLYTVETQRILCVGGLSFCFAEGGGCDDEKEE